VTGWRGPEYRQAWFDELAPALKGKDFATRVLMDVFENGGTITSAIAKQRARIAGRLTTLREPAAAPALDPENVHWACRPPTAPPPARGSFEAMMEMFVQRMGDRL
jgi:hypothetical protein